MKFGTRPITYQVPMKRFRSIGASGSVARGVLARGDGGSLAATAGPARDRANSMAQSGRIEVMRERAQEGFA
ncbi:hypothetical protein SM139_3887 [Stenotrophomonas maltophilia]|nr:hypothetical protein SM139_3887 [Stenotrophomonas maltophilia]